MTEKRAVAVKQNVETGFYKDPLTINQITMVGACTEELQPGGIDYSTLSFALRAASALGVSLSSAFDRFNFRNNQRRAIVDEDRSLIRKINIDPTEGGEDFLDPKTITDTDFLIFCNVAHGNSEKSEGGHMGELVKTFRGQALEEMDPMVLASLASQNASMRVSPYNNDDSMWLSQIDKSGANIVYFQNRTDDYPPERLAGDTFISVQDARHVFRGLAIRREFLKKASESFIDKHNTIDFAHPLVRLASLADNSSKSNFMTDLLGDRSRDQVLILRP